MGGRNRYLINGSNANNNRVSDMFRSVQLNINNPHFLIMQGRITKVWPISLGTASSQRVGGDWSSVTSTILTLTWFQCPNTQVLPRVQDSRVQLCKVSLYCKPYPAGTEHEASRDPLNDRRGCRYYPQYHLPLNSLSPLTASPPFNPLSFIKLFAAGSIFQSLSIWPFPRVFSCLSSHQPQQKKNFENVVLRAAETIAKCRRI